MFDSGKSEKIRKNMADYLKNIHEKEFEVEKPYIFGNEGHGYNTYRAKAYAKDNPELKFDVAWDKGDPGYYYDNYLSYLWSFQGEEEIRAKLRELYGQEVYLLYVFNTKKEGVKKLNHSEILSKYGDDSYFELKYYFFISGEFDKKVEAERVYKIFQNYITKNNVKYYHLVAYCFKESYRDEFLRSFSDLPKFKREFSSEKLHAESKLVNAVFINIKDSINSIDDIVKILQY